jgi:hypothetical protein
LELVNGVMGLRYKSEEFCKEKLRKKCWRYWMELERIEDANVLFNKGLL